MEKPEEIIKSYIEKIQKGSGKFTKPPEQIVLLIDEILRAQNVKCIETMSMSQKVWHFSNPQKKAACVECGASVKWNPIKKSYRLFCSPKCANKNKEKLKKTEKTFLKNGGYPSQRKEIKEKIKQTNLKKFGFTTPLSQPEVIQKSIKTTKNPNFSKKKSKWLSDNPKHFEKMKEGRKRFVKNNPHHISQTFRETSIQKLNINGVNDEKSLKDYLEKENETKMMSEIAKDIGIHISSLCKWFDRLGIRKSYHYTSIEQKEIEQWLSIHGVTVISNDRKILNGRELDLYLPDHKVAIEYCGLYWHSEIYKDKNYHFRKLEECNQKGISLITVFQDEYINTPDIVKRSLFHKLGISKEKSVYARKTYIKKISYKEAKTFLKENHIQGPATGFLYLGLVDKNEKIVAVSVVQKNSHNTALLSRYATSCKVVGGFSKMLKYIESECRNRGYQKIVTFADRRWSNGDLYIKNNFVKSSILDPDYSFCKNDVRIHKFNLRKLPKEINPKMSINEAARHMGYLKIWDCGKIKFEKVIS